MSERQWDDSNTIRIETCVREYRGERSELRIERREYNGKRYNALHVWETGPRGPIPTKKIVTIRDSELDRVIAALTEAKRIAVDERRAQGDPNNPEDHPPEWLTRFHARQDQHGGDRG